MNGEIKIFSQVNQGTQFRVSIPLKRTYAPIEQESTPTTEGIPNWKGRTILLIEDNLVNQTICEAMLESTDCEIIIANDGQEGVDLYTSKLPI